MVECKIVVLKVVGSSPIIRPVVIRSISLVIIILCFLYYIHLLLFFNINLIIRTRNLTW